MGKLTGEIKREGALAALLPIAKGEETKHALEPTNALLSILQLNEGGFVQQTLPEVYEKVRDTWLERIREAAQDTPETAIWESWAIDGLALAKNDERVTEGLVEAVRCARDEGRFLVEHCLRAIGALGHQSGRELLEYWQSKGNMTAQAALEAFGESMEAIKDREKAIEAERKAEREKEGEKEKLRDAQAIHSISELCYSAPGVALAMIESMIREKPTLAAEPALKFLKAKACGSIGFFQLIPPGVDPSPFGEDRLRNIVGITDQHLDLLEKGLWEIRKIEEAGSHALENVLKNYPEDQGLVDGLAMAVERCRPGRVQEILGKTKLWYFGKRVGGAPYSSAPTLKQVQPFSHIFFQANSIVKSALAVDHGTDVIGREYVACILYERSFEDLGPEETIEEAQEVGVVALFDDGTSYFDVREGKTPKGGGLGEAKAEETAKEKEKKEHEGKDLLAEALTLWYMREPGEHQKELLALTDEALDSWLWKSRQAQALYIQDRVLYEQGALWIYPIVTSYFPKEKQGSDSEVVLGRLLEKSEARTMTRFTDNGDGTVTDNRTGLMWAKDAGKGRMAWEKARAYCEALNLAGFSDWRLPTSTEIKSLLDPSNSNPALPTGHPFIGVHSNFSDGFYWSSTTDAYDTDDAVPVHLGRRWVGIDVKTFPHYVWPVRGYSVKQKKDKCFIATAAYGSAAAPDVVTLRKLRDLRLKQTQIGCLMIRVYERWSPALAQVIVRHPFAGRTVRRLIIAPVAWVAQKLLPSSDR
jgi:hypothetical protein